MPSFGKQFIFINFYSVVLYWIIPLSWRLCYMYTFSGYVRVTWCYTFKEVYVIFVLKYMTWLIIKPAMKKPAASGGWRWLYICKYFCKRTIWQFGQWFLNGTVLIRHDNYNNYIYGTVLIRCTLTIEHTNKPTFCIQSL